MNDTSIAAIDFETATPSRASACSVGVAISNGDGTARVREWLIQPPGNEYSGFNSMLHGITPRDTLDAPTIVEVWGEVSDFIGDRMLVAHNAAFDMSVLRSGFGYRQTSLPREYDYTCSYRMARVVWANRWSYRLSDIARDLGLDVSKHHEASWDAYAVLEIINAMMMQGGESTFKGLIDTNGFRIGHLDLNPDSWESFSGVGVDSMGGSWKASALAGDPTKFQPDHPFYQERIVITGALPNGMTRHEAYQHIVDIGGDVADGMSKKVNILVVADLDPFVIGDDGMSGKLRKARELAEKGHPVELMDSRDFIKLLGA